MSSWAFTQITLSFLALSLCLIFPLRASCEIDESSSAQHLLEVRQEAIEKYNDLKAASLSANASEDELLTTYYQLAKSYLLSGSSDPYPSLFFDERLGFIVNETSRTSLYYYVMLLAAKNEDYRDFLLKQFDGSRPTGHYYYYASLMIFGALPQPYSSADIENVKESAQQIRFDLKAGYEAINYIGWDYDYYKTAALWEYLINTNSIDVGYSAYLQIESRISEAINVTESHLEALFLFNEQLQ